MVNPIVIKFGGSLLEDKTIRRVFLQTLAQEWLAQKDPALAQKRGRVLLVHGGGKEITQELEKRKIPARFESGRRYTDLATMEVVEEVLARINKEIVSELVNNRADAYSLSGKTNSFLHAKPIDGLGLVGAPDKVNHPALQQVLADPRLPVFYTVAYGDHEKTLNINADDFAQELAISCKASQLIFMTDTGGVFDSSKKLISQISTHDIDSFIQRGIVTGGMSVKLQACKAAIAAGVESVVIGGEVLSEAQGLRAERGTTISTTFTLHNLD